MPIVSFASLMTLLPTIRSWNGFSCPSHKIGRQGARPFCNDSARCEALQGAEMQGDHGSRPKIISVHVSGKHALAKL